MQKWHKTCLEVAIFSLIFTISNRAAKCGEENALKAFPQKIANAVLIESPKIWDKKTVFDYMDGAAELYLRYGFKLLYTARYKLPDQIAIVELYDLDNSKNAFGVFSWDTYGEQLQVGQGGRYEENMLRCWQDKFFIKVKGEKQSQAFKQFAISIAKHVTDWIGKRGQLPDLMEILPKHLKTSNLRYFHFDEDLNTFYYISTENVLKLSNATEGIIVDCNFNESNVKIVVIRYPSANLRDEAARRFCEKILSINPGKTASNLAISRVKGKFWGIAKLQGKFGEPLLVICLEAKSQNICKNIFNLIAKSLPTKKQE